MSTVLPEAVVGTAGGADSPARARSLWRSVWTRPAPATGAALLVLAGVTAIFAPWIEPYRPTQTVGAAFAHPSTTHWLGLDGTGGDVVSLLIQGTRISLIVGAAAMAVAMVVGTTVGMLSGYFGGAVDGLLMRITDFFLVVPYLPLLIIVAAVWGASLWHIILVIGLLQWTWAARIVRAQVKSVRQRTYVRRARSLGAGNLRIISHHIFPQIAPLLVSIAVLHVGYAIFSEAALDFLGLGDPLAVSWGTMIEHAFQRTAVSNGAWWAIVPPGIGIAAVIVSCFLVGQGVEDALDPGLRRAHLSARTFRIRRPTSSATIEKR